MNWLNGALAAFALVLAGCSGTEKVREVPPLSGARAEAVFAGGCFWCVESDFEHLDGVYEAVSGYSGGTLENPTYHNHDDHLEAVRVSYDPTRISYEELLHHFWREHDPLDGNGQFCDRGHAYQPAIFVGNETERAAAEASKAESEQILGQHVVTPILPLGPFWEAEEYHQDYYLKNPVRYSYYRNGCGRDARIEQVWQGH
jgi:peptide-methionine (S)-S-oxide reductase